MQIGRWKVYWIGYPFDEPMWLFRRFPAGVNLIAGPFMVWRMKAAPPEGGSD